MNVRGVLLGAAALAACAPSPPPACERLARSFCEVAAVPCADAHELFVRAGLSEAQCVEGVEALPLGASVGADMRGYALAAFLREVLRGSPRLDAAEVDAMASRLGLPPRVAPAGGDAGAGGAPPRAPVEIPQHEFQGYMAVEEPAAEAGAAGE